MFPGLDLFSTYRDPAQHIITTAIRSLVDYLDDLDRDLSEVLKYPTPIPYFVPEAGVQCTGSRRHFYHYGARALSDLSTRATRYLLAAFFIVLPGSLGFSLQRTMMKGCSVRSC